MQTSCDTHAHTVASTHAYSTVHDYFAVAREKGIQLFAITDHAPAMQDAPHYWHFGNMKIIPRIVNGVAMLRGIEANILPAGKHSACGHHGMEALDIPPNLVPFLDISIASFHEPVFPPADIHTHTKAAIAAMESGLCQILGHPGNPNYPIHQEEVVRAAKDNNVAIEINNSSFTHSRTGSESYCLQLLELVDKHDWKVVFASDAHAAWDLGEHSACIAKAKAIGFPGSRVLSTSPAKLLAFLGEHRKLVAEELKGWLAGL
ncbi:phosphatase [Teredinibacter haidensis]|uniref:phosphatase n=1 Tax=Teredinibacter haidensis TaxID=2731755 RepID=UPI000948D3B5|nr:phosphatase [Teredinibacter haidensis]